VGSNGSASHTDEWREMLAATAEAIGVDPNTWLQDWDRLGPDERYEEMKRLAGSALVAAQQKNAPVQKKIECHRIHEDELARYLEDGWGLVREMSDGTILVRR
jgi:hypothetical protein